MRILYILTTDEIEPAFKEWSSYLSCVRSFRAPYYEVGFDLGVRFNICDVEIDKPHMCFHGREFDKIRISTKAFHFLNKKWRDEILFQICYGSKFSKKVPVEFFYDITVTL